MQFFLGDWERVVVCCIYDVPVEFSAQSEEDKKDRALTRWH